MPPRHSLLGLLLCSNLLTACLTPDDGITDDTASTDSESLTFPPCLIINYELSQIAEDAGATLAAGGAPGWSVFVSRRPSPTSAPCVATHSGGFARGIFDGYKAFTPDVSFPIASNSKIVTAVAAYKILRDHGLDPETTKIAAYLPSNWLLGPGVSNITFAELMTHTSGLTAGSLAGGWGGNLEGDLQLWLMIGVTQPTKPFSYANSGMVLLQLLAARIQYGPALYILSDKLTLSGSWLASYVSANFLAPHGIPANSSTPPSCTLDPGGAMAYPTGSSSAVWGGTLSPATDYARCGMGRWNFTARNFGLFLDRLRNNDLFANSALTTDFLNNEYGFDPTSASYLTKGGLLPSGDGQFKSRAYIFPDGTVAFVVINSDSAIGTAVPDAYDAANP
jgi:CubicO group peptidase (beta-lactamase class C family)